MRTNLPITNHEVVMSDDSIIVSKTDEKGKILFMNKDFLDIAGFTKEELMGQPHNAIRHPDMPSEAFEDMWRDLKAQLPWSGYVKNRTKNGDHYWVHANAMPEVENGRVTGYISIRRKPDAETVRAVDGIYRQFKEGKAGKLTIEHGRVVDNAGSAKRARWFEKLGNKIGCVAATLCFLIAAVGGVGIFVASHTTEALRTVYEDRTIPAGQLSDISDELYATLLHLNIIVNGQEDPTALIGKITESIPHMNKVWDAYMATYLTPEEKIYRRRPRTRP